MFSFIIYLPAFVIYRLSWTLTIHLISIHLCFQLGPVHPFITAKLTQPANSHEVQTMLAFYRANGGRLPQPPLNRLVPTHQPIPAPAPPPETDALDPAKHQRLSVLFCSYSHESPNAPAFCVNPW